MREGLLGQSSLAEEQLGGANGPSRWESDRRRRGRGGRRLGSRNRDGGSRMTAGREKEASNQKKRAHASDSRINTVAWRLQQP